MFVIPVIDLLDGHAVLAKGGHRSQYVPLSTPLCASSEPLSVAQALLSVAAPKTGSSVLYIADLNSLLQRSNNLALITRIAQQFPETIIWLDAGRPTERLTELYSSYKNIRPIVGSESFASLDELVVQLDLLQKYSPLLSLDFRSRTLLGPDPLLKHTECWPQDVIILALDQVGNKTGGDIELASSVKNRQVDRSYYFGGGVRTAEDIISLKTRGFTGVLVASSLHEKTLTEKELSRL